MLALSFLVIAAAQDVWVTPQGLPEGHNGGVKEKLFAPVAGKKPHILMILFDDYGWADAGWHRNYTGPGGVPVPATDGIQTPNLNQLVREGIELDRNYVYKYCSPTRSALQSGRNPYHVNPLNAGPEISNPDDPVSGFAAIPRNMTGVATKMAAGGYKTASFGKWDAGMATPDHTPHGRGYMTALNYFHHCNDYWSMTASGCHVPEPTPPQPLPSAKCGPNFPGSSWCAPSSPPLNGSGHATANAADCCAICTSTSGCEGWAWGLSYNPRSGNHSCNLKSEIKSKVTGKRHNCTSACRIGGTKCLLKGIPIVDLWQSKQPSSITAAAAAVNSVGSSNSESFYEGPANGMNDTCGATKYNRTSYPGMMPEHCKEGPMGSKWHGGYEDALFEDHLLDVIAAHDKDTPLFAFWAPHIVHTPLQVPQDYFDKFDFIAPTDREGNSRQLYHAMVNFADTAVGNVTAALKAKGMWDDTLIFFSSDNGGPIYNNGTAGANNYPLKGGKMNNWEGGIRVNGFISGGFIPAPRRGTKYQGLTTGWDWYATFSSFAGVDPTDHRAALAGLPPIDSYDHSAMIMGTNLTSPRTELPIGTEPRPSNISTAPACSSYDYATHNSYYADPRMSGHDKAPTLASYGYGPMGGGRGKCTTVSAVIVDEGEKGMWKLLTGDVQQDMYTGPHYPNSTTDEISNDFVGHCASGCLYNIKDDPLETTDLAAKMPDKVSELRAKIEKYETTAFNPKRGQDSGAACKKALGTYGGFWGPFVE